MGHVIFRGLFDKSEEKIFRYANETSSVTGQTCVPAHFQASSWQKNNIDILGLKDPRGKL